MKRIALTLAGLFSLALAGCPSDDDNKVPDAGTGGRGGTGGTGGSAGTGGTGGTAGTGGSSGTGGTRPPDGRAPDRGRPADTGRGTDVRPSDGGSRDTGGSAAVDPNMSFFITSRGGPNGGDFRATPADTDGLAGADALCKSLATAVSAQLGAKNWRAYLSTSTVDARTRIGTGPWVNARGVTIAQNLQQLHEEGGMVNTVRVTGMPSNGLNERGEGVPMGGGMTGVHDILTGSNAMGIKNPMGNHCTNWTSTMGLGFVGHHDRAGGAVSGNQVGAWNAVHTVGCGAIMGTQNGVATRSAAAAAAGPSTAS